MGSLSKDRLKEVKQVTIVGMVVNILLSAAKLYAGIVGRSSAMIADAVHSISDLFTDFIVLAGAHFGSRPEDKGHPFGHGRLETFATLIIALVLFLTAYGIFVEALGMIRAMMNGKIVPRPGIIALVMAAVSIVSKEALYHYTVLAGRRLKSEVTISNAWHHRSDALSSIAVLLGIGGIYIFGERAAFLDPLAAIVVSGFIFKVGVSISKTAVDEIMDKSFESAELEKIKFICLNTPGVSNPHDLKTRKIGCRASISVAVDLDKDTSFQDAYKKTRELEKLLRREFGEDAFILVRAVPDTDTKAE